ncbi:MAG TPA: Wzz/FepE/Etk N-terminal domain-containing protein [Candidatus Kapabacteria bacterium]|nr:Wzz/FepE/Etk N-terminal domain-containing protein [Candidatus Kapabacteria bacterium]
MEKQNVNNVNDVNDVNDEIDLIRVVKVLIKRKWLIIGGILAITLAAFIISLVLPKTYQSTAFFRLSSGFDLNLEELKQIQDKVRDNLHNDLLYNLTLAMLLDDNFKDMEMLMKNVSFPDYKKYSALFTNSYRFSRFLEQKKQAGDKDARELMSGKGPGVSIANSIEPVYAYSKKDLKELTQNPREARNFVVGVELKVENETPGKARALVDALGEFIKDSILLGNLGDYITAQWNKSSEELKKIDNFIIKDEVKLQQLTAKRNDIAQLLKKYPGSGIMGGRESLSGDKNDYRYLPPAAQWIGIESYMADLKENLSQNGREKELAELKLAFFVKAREMMAGDREIFGYTTLDSMMKSLDSFFDEKKGSANAVRQVKNELAIDFQKLVNMYEEMQFLSAPTLSRTPIRPKKNLILAVGFVLGLLLSVFLAFAVDWWAINKQKISYE